MRPRAAEVLGPAGWHDVTADAADQRLWVVGHQSRNVAARSVGMGLRAPVRSWGDPPPAGRGVPRNRARAGRGRRGRDPGPPRRPVRPLRADGVADGAPPRRRRLPRGVQPGAGADAEGPRPSRAGRAQAPPRRAAADRRDRSGVGQGPRGGRPLGARDLRRGRGRCSSACSATRRRARTETRSPASARPAARSPRWPRALPATGSAWSG